MKRPNVLMRSVIKFVDEALECKLIIVIHTWPSIKDFSNSLKFKVAIGTNIT